MKPWQKRIPQWVKAKHNKELAEMTLGEYAQLIEDLKTEVNNLQVQVVGLNETIKQKYAAKEKEISDRFMSADQKWQEANEQVRLNSQRLDAVKKQEDELTKQKIQFEIYIKDQMTYVETSSKATREKQEDLANNIYEYTQKVKKLDESIKEITQLKEDLTESQDAMVIQSRKVDVLINDYKIKNNALQILIDKQQAMNLKKTITRDRSVK